MNRGLIHVRRKICQLSKSFEIGYGGQPNLQFGGYLRLFRRVKLPTREADNLPISSAKNECSCNPPAVRFRGAYKDSFSLLYRSKVVELRVSQIEGKFSTTSRRALLQLGVNTCYGLDGPGIESRWGQFFCTLPDRPWSLPSLLYNGYWLFPGVRAAGAWRWPPTSI